MEGAVSIRGVTDRLKTRFPAVRRAYRRHVAPRFAKDKRAYRVERWAVEGLELVGSLGIPRVAISDGEIWVTDHGGIEWLYTPGVFLSAAGAEYGIRHREAGVALVRDRLGRQGTFVDVGANVGSYVVDVARARPDAEIHGFEPVSATRRVLERNIERNGVGLNVHVWPLAVGAEPGNAQITTEHSVCNYLVSVAGGPRGGTEEVEIVALDEFLEGRVEKVDFLKCDIEGAELEVMRGAERILTRDRPDVLLEIDARWAARYGHTPSEVVGFFEERGYTWQRLVGDRLEPPVDLDRALAEGNNFLFEAPR